MARFVALLRGINVGGNKKVPMAALRTLCEGLGWTDVQTYVQSGNVVFVAKGNPAQLAAALAGAIEQHFGFPVPVLVRTAAAWRTLAATPAFADAAAERPQLLHVACVAAPVPQDAVARLLPYCKDGERVAVAATGATLWLDYAGGVARSKLAPAVLDRVCGAVVTARNWNTVQALAAMLKP